MRALFTRDTPLSDLMVRHDCRGRGPEEYQEILKCQGRGQEEHQGKLDIKQKEEKVPRFIR